MISREPQIEYVERLLRSADGGFAARRRGTNFSISRFVSPPARCSCNLCGHFGSGPARPPYIISHFILSPFSKTAPRLSPPLISPPPPRTAAGPRPPFPPLHLHLGSTRLPKCFLGVRWLIGSHLLGESSRRRQEFHHIDLVWSSKSHLIDEELFIDALKMIVDFISRS